jgi:hypothetical protein
MFYTNRKCLKVDPQDDIMSSKGHGKHMWFLYNVFYFLWHIFNEGALSERWAVRNGSRAITFPNQSVSRFRNHPVPHTFSSYLEFFPSLPPSGPACVAIETPLHSCLGFRLGVGRGGKSKYQTGAFWIPAGWWILNPVFGFIRCDHLRGIGQVISIDRPVPHHGFTWSICLCLVASFFACISR